MSGRVDIDMTDVVRGVRQLQRGVERRTPSVALDNAAHTADRVRTAMPKRTGAAAGSVRANRHGGGTEAIADITAGVPYFGWLNWGGTRGRPYVSDGRYTGPAFTGADERFHRDCEQLAAQEIRKL
ncbi:MAG TPA: hypothetical protein VKB59_22720 [Micromonosporaceae bacterium]|nr:hypothetical protein [Micromonosporaceae bacterium]